MVFAIHWHESAIGCTCVPHPEPPSPFIPQGRLSGPALSHAVPCLMQCPVSCIKPGLVICFTYGNIHVSMLFSQIIPPSPFPTESKSLFCISVSLLLSHIQGHHYHLSKFHIYVLVYCNGVFLSGLLHSILHRVHLTFRNSSFTDPPILVLIFQAFPDVFFS